MPEQPSLDDDPYELRDYLADIQEALIDQYEERAVINTRREILLRAFDRRGLEIDAATRAQVLEREDPVELEIWIDRVFTATSAADVLDV